MSVILPALSQPFRQPAPEPPAGRTQSGAFGDLLTEERQPARRQPPAPDDARSAPPASPRTKPGSAEAEPAELDSAGSGSAEPSSFEQPGAAAASSDGSVEETEEHARQRPRPDEDKERTDAPPPWPAGLQPAAALREPAKAVPQSGADASTGSLPDAKAGAGGASASPVAEAPMEHGLSITAMALRQRLRGAGEAAAVPGAADNAAAGLEARPVPDGTPAHVTASRRSRAAAASLGLFRESGRANFDDIAPKQHSNATKAREFALPAEDKEQVAGQQPSSLLEGKPMPILAGGMPSGGGFGQSVPPRDLGPVLAAAIPVRADAAPAAMDAAKYLPANHMQALEIRLHPAELGSVTARLKITEQQLSVEITADSAGGLESLAEQEGAIRASLEALGFRVDRLTIQQAPEGGRPPPGGAPGGRQPDGNAFGSAGGSGAGGGAGGNGGSAGHAGGNEGKGRPGASVGAPARLVDSGSGLFI